MEFHFTDDFESEFENFVDMTEIERVDIFKASAKIRKVINSCKTKDHFVGADNMIQNFHRVYEDDPEENNCTNSLYLYLIKSKNI